MRRSFPLIDLTTPPRKSQPKRHYTVIHLVRQFLCLFSAGPTQGTQALAICGSFEAYVRPNEARASCPIEFCYLALRRRLLLFQQSQLVFRATERAHTARL